MKKTLVTIGILVAVTLLFYLLEKSTKSEKQIQNQESRQRQEQTQGQNKTGAYARAIRRTDEQFKSLFPDWFASDQMGSNVNKLPQVLETIGSYRLDFTGCPDDYVKVVLDIQEIYREMSRLMKDFEELSNQRSTVEGMAFIEILGLGNSPTATQYTQKQDQLATRIQELSNAAERKNSEMDWVKSKYGM